LPQLRLAICGGGLLVSLHLLAEYGLFAMIRFDTFATAILDQFQSAYSAPAANMLGGVLILSCGIVLLIEAAARGQERYARVGSGAVRPILRHRLHRYAWLCALIPLATAMLSIGVPFLTLGRWLLIGGLSVWPPMEIGSALGQTFFYAATGAALTTCLAIPMAWLTVRAPGRCQRWLEACHYWTGSLPGVIIALALVAVTVHLPGIYQTAATLLLAYMLLFLPRALIGLRTSIAQAPVELEEAASALGRGRLATLWRVTLPLAAPGVAASMSLVGLGITTELTATLMLAPNGTRTLATEFWALTSEIDYVRAAPYAVMMVILSLPMTVLLHRQSRKAGLR
jgi:iron(III) transport system permease protein